MSRGNEGEEGQEQEGGWGPSHQHKDPPTKQTKSHTPSTIAGVLALLFILAMLRLFIGNFVGVGRESLFGWLIVAAVVLYLGRGLITLFMVALTRPARAPVHPNPHTARRSPPVDRLEPPATPAALARERVLRVGGGAYLGVGEDGQWAIGAAKHAVLVLGPPQSGKSTAGLIPLVMAASGPLVSASTKPDVLEATLAARSELGQAWLFDPSGTETLPEGVRRLSWSPVAAAATYDEALVMARAMTAATRVGSGTTNENHWSERARALLAPLLYAANQADLTIGEVLEWILYKNLEPALQILRDCDAPIAVAVLAGIDGTDSREKSSIFSATAGVLSAYNSDAVRASAASPNFDPDAFADSTDTIYITSSEEYQALCAPLIVGLLEQIRHAVYRRSRRMRRTRTRDAGPAMTFAIDEIANIAPIHDLPSLLSQAGGQGLQLVAGLQDFSQARERWGEHAADGFMSLFQTKLILTGIGDSKTLEGVSLALGEYDRQVVGQSLGHSEPQEFMSTETHSDNVSYQTQRQRVLTPGEIGRLPDGQGLLLRGNDWEPIKLTNWFDSEPWLTIAGHGAL
jgi:type IV secretory pathway TraG/TraD family ATPase VirD4